MRAVVGALIWMGWLIGGGWWLRGLHEARKATKARPYEYTWNCPECDGWLRLQGDNPSTLSAVIERINAKHVCGVPLI